MPHGRWQQGGAGIRWTVLGWTRDGVGGARGQRDFLAQGPCVHRPAVIRSHPGWSDDLTTGHQTVTLDGRMTRPKSLDNHPYDSFMYDITTHTSCTCQVTRNSSWMDGWTDGVQMLGGAGGRYG
eukprot:118133-Chlamydomonas_euryale.AAC.3